MIRAIGGFEQKNAAFAFVLSLLVVAFAYRQGLGSSFNFDDPHNLGGLSRIVDFNTAVEYILSGGGPIGRPLALASFAVEAYGWPVAPAVFLHTNMCLHLLNGVLVVWMLYLLGMAAGKNRRQAAEIATMSGAMWMALPILASSSLLAVQRMTLLSATFVIVGVIAYLYSRSLLERRPWTAIVLMSSSLMFATFLAVLCKENGALLPVLVLVMEATFLRRAQPPAKFRGWWTAWRSAFLVLPAVLVVGYLVRQVPYSDWTVATRSFSAADRLLTELHILWEYLRNAFLPWETTLGPFHDDHPIHRDWLAASSLLALASWIGLAAAAIALRNRLGPWPGFAIAWFLTGHLLESTTIPLELYFEHRNYVPLIGPVFVMVAALWSAKPEYQRIARGGLIAYVIVLAVVLFNTTSLWGRPLLAAEMWSRYHPDSRRAMQYLAAQYEQAGDRATTRRVLIKYYEKHPESADVALQILATSCLLEPDEAADDWLRTAESKLTTGGFEVSVYPTLERFYGIVTEVPCQTVTPETIYRLASLTALNPAYQVNNVAMHNLNVLMAREAISQGRIDDAMHHIDAALSAHPAKRTAQFAAEVLHAVGRPADAERYLTAAQSHTPANPLHSILWKITAMIGATTISTNPK